VAIIAEDVRFVDFLVPAICTMAGGAGVQVRFEAVEKTRGCRPERLRQLASDIRPRVDVITIGVDSDGPTHGAHGLSRRQKGQHLTQRLGSDSVGAVLAIAVPSVEAWLLADAGAFRDGIETALGLRFQMPRHWPNPRSERQAKEGLGSVVFGGIGASLPLAGFEYAEYIVPKMSLRDSPNESLRAWVRQFEGLLRRSR
jgi:hypothetical protein